MSNDPKRPRKETQKDPELAPLSFDIEDAIGDARAAISNGLLEHLNRCLIVGEQTGIRRDDISEGLLISLLELIAPGGEYPMDEGRFWQILDRHEPFPALAGEDSTRAGLIREFESLFAAAENESFEDGFDSGLSVAMQRLVLQHDGVALDITADLILQDRATPEVAREALVCLGEMEHAGIRDKCRAVLERALVCSSHIARDGAVTALANVRDPKSTPALRAAAEREDHGLLRANMLELARQLEGHVK